MSLISILDYPITGALFFYYTRGKTYIEKYVKDANMPSMPSMPSMPKMPKKLTSSLNWPLSNIQMKNLPLFMKKGEQANPQTTKVMSKTNIDISKRPLPARPPQPPPRVKRPSASTPKVGPIQRPSAPPPAVPIATLEIGEPTSVSFPISKHLGLITYFFNKNIF